MSAERVLLAEEVTALRAPFPDGEVGKLPRVTCKDCQKSGAKVCDKHAKSKCSVCGNYITGAHIHLDYVGHAETTDRLLAVDPEWSWEPIGWSETGAPLITEHQGNLVMWGRLTVCGITRLGVGTAPSGKDDAHKELVGDFLRNAAMRFGVALDLWRKSERVEHHDDTPEPVMADATTHQTLRDTLSSLSEDQLAAYQKFGREHRIPAFSRKDSLTEAQAAQVLEFFDTLSPVAGDPEPSATGEPVNGEPFE